MAGEAKNLEAIYKAIDVHNKGCPYPPTLIIMNPHEVERLGWDEIRGIPIKGDGALGTGVFRILCGGDSPEGLEEEVTEAIAEEREVTV